MLPWESMRMLGMSIGPRFEPFHPIFPLTESHTAQRCPIGADLLALVGADTPSSSVYRPGRCGAGKLPIRFQKWADLTF
jgi:hypothetical protein